VRLAGRLKRLERRVGDHGPCPCGGRWSEVLAVKSPDDPTPPKGCPSCGKVGTVKVLVGVDVERV
jgi:hypothetical protein